MAARSAAPNTASRFIPELDHRGVAYLVLVLGAAGLVTELVSTVFVPRMVLYAVVLAAGILGLVRRRPRAVAPNSVTEDGAVTVAYGE